MECAVATASYPLSPLSLPSNSLNTHSYADITAKSPHPHPSVATPPAPLPSSAFCGQADFTSPALSRLARARPDSSGDSQSLEVRKSAKAFRCFWHGF